MSNTTITLAGSIAFAQTRIGYAPLTTGTSNEPAITSANMVLQTILAPPFKWSWNRGSLIQQLVANQQDYTGISATTFGYAEKATIQGSATITAVQAGAGTATFTVSGMVPSEDRKSTRLNSSHVSISYAVFCLKTKITILSYITFCRSDTTNLFPIR